MLNLSLHLHTICIISGKTFLLLPIDGWPPGAAISDEPLSSSKVDKRITKLFHVALDFLLKNPALRVATVGVMRPPEGGERSSIFNVLQVQWKESTRCTRQRGAVIIYFSSQDLEVTIIVINRPAIYTNFFEGFKLNFIISIELKSKF